MLIHLHDYLWLLLSYHGRAVTEGTACKVTYIYYLALY